MCLALPASTAWTGRMAVKVENFDHADSCRMLGKASGVIELMQMGLIPLSTVLVLSLLQACIKRKDLATGRRLHFLIITSDFDTVSLLGDQFIRLFASCGSLMEANLLFCNTSKPSSCTWQAIINAHTTLGESKKALELYQKMQEEGIKASKYIYTCVLRACGYMGALGQGKHVHDEIIKSGFQSDVIVGNTLIDMYAKCGSSDGALKVFSHLLNRDVVSWNAIIAGYAQQGHGLLAIDFFEKMQQEGTCPDRVTFLCLSKACGCVGAIDQGKRIHCQINKCGIEIDVIVGSSLVDMYGKCGSLKLAHEVFDGLPERNVVSWNGLIGGYAQDEFSYRALELFEKMQDDGIRPNCVTFLCLLKACGNIGSIEHGEILHAQILKSGFESDASVGNALVDMYSKCGNLELAHSVFDELPSRSVVSWGALISGYSEHGQGLSALELFWQMQQEGIKPDRVMFLCALKVCASTESIGQGKLVYKQVIEGGLEYDITVGNTLLDMYAKCGRLEEACKVFDQLRNRDVVSCNTMIAANLQHGHGFHAIEILDTMEQKGIKPDKVTFLSSLKACGSIGAIGQGKLIHELIIRSGFETDTVVGTTLVDMYAKFGSLKEARNVFDKLPNPNLVSWSAMIAAYSKHGEICLAAQCVRDMQKQGLKPDGNIYSSLFMACSHAGQVEEGYQHFKAMTKDYGIVPTLEHFNCMVELLSRAGRLKEAEKVLQTMPVSPDVTGWISLLTACKAYGNHQLGMKCFNQAVKLKSSVTGGYVLMSSIYTDAHMWEGARHIQDLRSSADARRKPGRAWIEISNKVHEFTVGDLTHLQTNQIFTKLNRLNMPIKQEGYVPQADMSLNDDRVEEDIQVVSCDQSEKRAMAFM